MWFLIDPRIQSSVIRCLSTWSGFSRIIEFCFVLTHQTVVKVWIWFSLCFICCFILIVLYFLSFLPWVISLMCVTCVLLPPLPALVYRSQAVWLLVAALSGLLRQQWATGSYLSCFLCFDLPSMFPGWFLTLDWIKTPRAALTLCRCVIVSVLLWLPASLQLNTKFQRF